MDVNQLASYTCLPQSLLNGITKRVPALWTRAKSSFSYWPPKIQRIFRKKISQELKSKSVIFCFYKDQLRHFKILSLLCVGVLREVTHYGGRIQVHIMCLIFVSHSTILKIFSLYISNCPFAFTVCVKQHREMQTKHMRKSNLDTPWIHHIDLCPPLL